MTKAPDPWSGFRFPAAVIERAVRLYRCFTLRLRRFETILAGCGVLGSYENIRAWSLGFGHQVASALKRRRPKHGYKWHLEEVFIRIRTKQHHRRHAIDEDGHVLEILVQGRRNTRAARRFFRKLLRSLHYAPRVIITDKLISYTTTKRCGQPSGCGTIGNSEADDRGSACLHGHVTARDAANFTPQKTHWATRQVGCDFLCHFGSPHRRPASRIRPNTGKVSSTAGRRRDRLGRDRGPGGRAGAAL